MYDGSTALILAARLAVEGMVEELITCHADVNAVDELGECSYALKAFTTSIFLILLSLSSLAMAFPHYLSTEVLSLVFCFLPFLLHYTLVVYEKCHRTVIVRMHLICNDHVGLFSLQENLHCTGQQL